MKRLKDSDLEEMLLLLLEGKTAMDISVDLDCSISTVNNYRLKFKKAGYVFPDNRGGRSSFQEVISKPQLMSKPELTDKIQPGWRYEINGVDFVFEEVPTEIEIKRDGINVKYN